MTGKAHVCSTRHLWGVLANMKWFQCWSDWHIFAALSSVSCHARMCMPMLKQGWSSIWQRCCHPHTVGECRHYKRRWHTMLAVWKSLDLRSFHWHCWQCCYALCLFLLFFSAALCVFSLPAPHAALLFLFWSMLFSFLPFFCSFFLSVFLLPLLLLKHQVTYLSLIHISEPTRPP